MMLAKKFVIRLITIGFAVTLVACGGSSDRELEAPSSGKKLDPDSKENGRLLTFIETKREKNALALPPNIVDSTDPALVNNLTKEQEALNAQRVLPEITGARIVNEAELSWVEVDADAAFVWDRLVEFWISEDISLSEINPEAGIMETDWIENRTDNDSATTVGYMKALLNRVIGNDIEHDRYRFRLARDEGKTRVFISHQATVKEEVQYNSQAKVSDFEWVMKKDNYERVAEMQQIVVLLFDESKLEEIRTQLSQN